MASELNNRETEAQAEVEAAGAEMAGSAMVHQLGRLIYVFIKLIYIYCPGFAKPWRGRN